MKSAVDQNQLNDITSLNYCFYGAGSLAEAFVRGMLANEVTIPDCIHMLNRSNKERLVYLNGQYGVKTSNDDETKARWLHEADVIVLLMKPKDAFAALKELRPLLRPETLIVSAVAGLSIAAIQRILGHVSVVRTMPNTSCTIGLGATGICFSSEVTEQQHYTARQMLTATGIVAEVEEQLMDTITGVSGSGPAYIYYFMEAMIDAGVAQGLEPEQAHALVVQTVLGAAEMVRRTGEAPSELRRKVTSPGGTTQAALEVLNQNQLRETIRTAIASATDRATEMGAEIVKQMS
ncbi:pyrroline-5-carboxylate reductase [Paenibacillus marinisediminis]